MTRWRNPSDKPDAAAVASPFSIHPDWVFTALLGSTFPLAGPEMKWVGTGYK